MGRLNTAVLGISQRVKSDRALGSILLTIASGGYSKKEYDEALKLITQVYWLSGREGYSIQTDLVRRRVTRDGLVEVATTARKKGIDVGEKVIAAIEKQPEFVTAIKNTVLGETAVREGTGKGQLVSADEFGLGYKTWVYTGVSETSRSHHVAMGGTTIGKKEKFELPNGVITPAPHDWSIGNAAKEWTNCGCQVIYTNKRK